LLGVNGVVVIGHGRSNAYAIKQAVGQARRIAQQNVLSAIAEGIESVSMDGDADKERFYEPTIG
jgi:glycerol-3-phosphate acyltransferase PlsX